MYKPVPGNHNYLISLDGKMQNRDGSECALPITSDGKVTIDIYGESRLVDTAWLGLAAHFEINLPDGLRDKLWDINFIPANPRAKIKCKKVMLFKRPLLVLKEYRVIPQYVRYCVAKDGRTIDLYTLKSIQVRSRGDNYPTVDVFDPDRQRYRSIAIHRLVALAWVPNKDPYEKYVVNHIDGNKTNYNSNNLEWVTVSENNLHAFETGLRTDNRRCKLRNAYTGEVHEFYSISKAVEFTGTGMKDMDPDRLKYKTRHKLIAGKYEFRLEGDNEEWFYEKHPLGTISGRYHLIVTYPDKRKEIHTDVRTFKKDFKVWNISNVLELKEKTEKMYPGISVQIVDHYVVQEVQAYKVETGEIIEASGARPMARLLNQPIHLITSALNGSESVTRNGYAYRYKTDKPWDTAFTEHKERSWRITASNQLAGNTIEFTSLSAAAKYFYVDRSVIKRCLLDKVKYNGWEFKEKES